MDEKSELAWLRQQVSTLTVQSVVMQLVLHAFIRQNPDRAALADQIDLAAADFSSRAQDYGFDQGRAPETVQRTNKAVTDSLALWAQKARAGV